MFFPDSNLEVTPMNQRILPTELFIDVFQALPRIEVEKCQLICYKWCSIVQEHSQILPLHLFYRLKFGREPNPPELDPNYDEVYLSRKDGEGHIPILIDSCDSDYVISSLKNCIFMACGPLKLNLTTYANIQKLAKKCGQKLNIIIFSTFGHFYDDLDDYAEFLLCLLSKFLASKKETVLGKSISPNSVYLTLNEEDTYHFLENPGLVQIPKSIDTQFSLHCDTFTFKDGKKLLDFMKDRELTGAWRFSMKFGKMNNGDDFCEKLIETFERSNPQNLVKCFHFSTWSISQFKKTMDAVESRKIKPKVGILPCGASFTYELKRSDGWTLIVMLSEQLIGNVSKTSSEFTIGLL